MTPTMGRTNKNSKSFNRTMKQGEIISLQRKAAIVELLKSQLPRREPNRVRVVRPLDRMLHQSCYQKPLSYYYTTGRKVLCPRIVENEVPPYFIDAQRRTKERVHLDYISTLPNYLKPSRRDKPVIGLSDRLHIPMADPEYPTPATVTKLAPDYYQMIEGTPVEEAFFSKKGYIDRLNKTFYSRLSTAIREEVEFVKEEKKLKELGCLIYIRNEYVEMIELFNQYLIENMMEQAAITDVAVKLGKLVEMKAIQIEMAHNSIGNIKDSLFDMDKILCYRRICKMTMDDFLETKRIEIRLAPEYWKREYTKEKAKLQSIADKAADHVLQMFAYFKLEIPFPEKSLEQLVLRLANTIRNLGPPAQYFKRPEEVHLALKKLEHSTVVAVETLSISCRRKEDMVEKEMEVEREERKSLNLLRMDIDIIKNEFSKKLASIITIEEETGVIMSYWRAVTTNPDLLQAFVHIKCLYEEFIGDEAPTKDIVEMISLLTEKIINVQMQVDSLPWEETHRIYSELKCKDDCEMQNALMARKLKIETEKMLKKMKRYFENRFSHPGIPHHFKVSPAQKSVKIVETPRPITPPNKRVLKNVLKIFQPTISEEAYLNFLDSIKNLEKVEDQLKWVHYPVTYPKTVAPDFTEPPSTPSLSFDLDEKYPGDSADTSTSYLERMKADVAKCSVTELSD